ncbi:MAG TPA: transglutaminase-like domain-containing protein [Methanothrix sp.]|nr:transglutaminase-like domain-containing protein [Methanothrix sp.]
MSLLAFWFCVIIVVGSGVATDVPFIFDGNYCEIAGYSADQLKCISTSFPELSGVPPISKISDDEVISFPVSGGAIIPARTTNNKVGELKVSFCARVEPNNSAVRHEAVVLAAKYPGDRTIDQISSIYSYLKNGADSKKGWSYVADTRGIDSFMYANETLRIGEEARCVGAGDCDDFAILMSALIESIGGTTRIILARNNITGGHAYAEVYLGNLNEPNNQVDGIIEWLKGNLRTDKIYTHIDADTKDVWLNMDWGPDEKGNTHPGGPLYPGDKHIVILIRDGYAKAALNLPESSQKNPQQKTISQPEGVKIKNINQTKYQMLWESIDRGYSVKDPFKESSDLSKFGKQRILGY